MEKEATNIIIIKKADDMRFGFKTLRASLGGTEQGGFYVTYRGDLPEIIDLVERCLAGLKAIPKEPEVAPDMGKKYA